jgi:lysyl-tRNA synthetase class 2
VARASRATERVSTPSPRRLVSVELHRHGPRLHVLGRRLHEWHLGALLASGVAVVVAAGVWPLNLWTLAAIAAGVWMIAKDWRDLLPRTRDTGAWGVGFHRRASPLRAIRHAEGLPTLAAAIAFAVGVVNLVSALTPNIAWRGHLLLQLLPIRAVPVFHTLAVPASLALIVTARSLRRRRRRALHVAVALLVVLGVFDLLKGLDLEEAALSWAAAAVLLWGRAAFAVRPAPLRPRALAAIVAGFVTAVGGVIFLSWLAAGPGWTPDQVITQTVDLFTWTRGSVAFRDDFSWVPLCVGLLTLGFIVTVGYVLFRPLPAPRELPTSEQRTAAQKLVRDFGTDTLAFFKLRRDLQYLFDDEHRAFLGYRIENDVLLVAGDPVGPAGALPGLLTRALVFAEGRGLRVAVLGASKALLPLWRAAGFRSLYLGSEAVVETERFSLEGRAIRKVRQSVSRLERAGFVATADRLAELDRATLVELEHVSEAWRAGAPERGFSMAMDDVGGEQQADSVVISARDESGAIRAFLHFVPSCGGAMSLSFMRREHGTPNGLTEFLVVRAIELLRERGVAELSLNFAAFGRLLERPAGRFERVLARFIRLGNRYFQIESLYRFNAKFMPRWEPRYLLFESLFGLPRVGLAAMRAEGQFPKLRAS